MAGGKFGRKKFGVPQFGSRNPTPPPQPIPTPDPPQPDTVTTVQYPRTLLYDVQRASGALVFRNGLLVREYDDYAAGRGYLQFVTSVVTDIIHAYIYQGGGPTFLRLTRLGLTAVGAYSLRLSPGNISQTVIRQFMLFRNGLLQTEGNDYTVNGPWISLISASPILDSDEYTAVISMGGTACSTGDLSIAGLINSNNATFYLPFVSTLAMIFRNGLLLVRGLDYRQDRVPTYAYNSRDSAGILVYRNGFLQTIYTGDFVDTTSPFEIPAAQPFDIVTARLYPEGNPTGGGPTFLSTVDGTIVNVSGGLTYRLIFAANPSFGWPQDLMLYRNGILLTQNQGYTVQDFWITLSADQALLQGDVLVAVTSFRGFYYSTFNGTINGAVDGVNQVFRLPYFDSNGMLFLNGRLLTQYSDYLVIATSGGDTVLPAGVQFGGGQFGHSQFGGRTGTSTTVLPVEILLLGNTPPQPGDTLTAEVFLARGPRQITTEDGSIVRVENGRFQTEFVMLDTQIPIDGDIITAQLFDSERYPAFPLIGPAGLPSGSQFGNAQFDASVFGGEVEADNSSVVIAAPPDFPLFPVECNNIDGSLSFAQARTSWISRNGVLLTQPLDATAIGNEAFFKPWQYPREGDVISVQQWTPDITDVDEPELNLPQQYTSAAETVTGIIDGVNRQFVVVVPVNPGSATFATVLVTAVIVFRNGLFMTDGVDYTIAGQTITFNIPQTPQVGDILTAQVFLD